VQFSLRRAAGRIGLGARDAARGPAHSRAHRDLFLSFFVGLIALAWLALFMWERSPYGVYLSHGELGGIAHGASAGTVLAQALLYVAGWTLMTAAMMLPTTVPLVAIFRRLTHERAERTQLVVLLILGYVAVWLVFGVAAHLFDLGLHAALHESAWLQENVWVFGAGPLLVAGAFQFSKLKYRCLDKCRAPLSFVIAHWRGSDTRLQALRLGAHHGLFCVGCCWALMLLMFAVGTGSIGWMLVLGAIMALEKNMPWGRRLAAPLGIALLAWGVLIVLDHSWSWQG
jgi:predicted metal-binding membrane protein